MLEVMLVFKPATTKTFCKKSIERIVIKAVMILLALSFILDVREGMSLLKNVCYNIIIYNDHG